MEWLSQEVTNQYYERAIKLPKNGGQDIGEWRELRIKLQRRCGILEIEAINILRGRYLNQYVRIYERRAKMLLSDIEIAKDGGDEIRPKYHHVESCQQTVPEAITAFLERTDFEDVIRTAVSLGGDCDTPTCIAGSIAEAFYGVPDPLIMECRKRLDEDILKVVDRFYVMVKPIV